FAVGHDVLDRYSNGQQKIADQPPMTLPEKSFGTHDGGSFSPGNLQQILDSLPELLGEHVIRIIPESFVSEADVAGFTLMFATATSQRLEPMVFNTGIPYG